MKQSIRASRYSKRRGSYDSTTQQLAYRSDNIIANFMSDSKIAVDKLQRIQQLWKEGRTKSDDPNYKTLLKNIRTLSAEYQVLVDTAKKPSRP
jgi:hypothetical protein